MSTGQKNKNSIGGNEQIVDDDVRPWYFQAWDTDASFTAFQYCYLNQKRPRSVAEAWRQHCQMHSKPLNMYRGKQLLIPNYFSYWANGMDSKGKRPPGTPFEHAQTWFQRARARDDEEQAISDAQWFSRQAEIRNKEWEIGSVLIQRADDLLAAKPAAGADFRESDVANLYELAMTLKRRAAGMPEKVTAIDWRKEVSRMGLDPDQTLENLVQQLIQHSGPEY